jgi:hypothetical protein
VDPPKHEAEALIQLQRTLRRIQPAFHVDK